MKWVIGLTSIVLFVAFVAFGMAMPGQAKAQGTPLPAEEAPDELVVAIEGYMDSALEGESSGTNCQAAINEGAAGGSWCWSLLEIDDSEAVIGFGQVQTDVGAEPVIFVHQSDGSWVRSSASPGAPETGTGTGERAGTASTVWVAGLFAVALFGALSIALARSRRQHSG